MCKKSIHIVALTVVVICLAFPGIAVSIEKSKFLVATGQEVTFNVPDPGTATCVGGIPTGNPYYPCVGSSAVLIKHQVVQAKLIPQSAMYSMLAGYYTATVDCGLDGDLKGHCWGTFEWNVRDGEKWLGTLDGSFDFVNYIFEFQMTGRGFGGALRGLQLYYEAAYPSIGTDPLKMIGDFTAVVNNPKVR